MKVLRFVPILALTLGFSGCSLFSFKKPDITSTKIEIRSADLQKLNLKLVLDIQNPNDVDVPLENLQAKVSIDDNPFLDRAWKDLPTLKQKSTTQVELPFELDWDRMIQAALKFATNHRLPYRIKGTVRVKGIALPFDEKGELSLDKMTESK